MPSSFGAHLQSLLTERGLSGLGFARRVGTASSTISQISSGKRTPPLERMDAWATALGLKGAARARFIELAQLAHCPEPIAREYVRQQERLLELEAYLQTNADSLPSRAADQGPTYRS